MTAKKRHIKIDLILNVSKQNKVIRSINVGGGEIKEPET